MKRVWSLAVKMWGSYLAVLLVVLLGISVGSSLLIRSYVIDSKEQELVRKGVEMTRMLQEYREQEWTEQQFLASIDRIDRFLDARILILDQNRQVIAISVPQAPPPPQHHHGMQGPRRMQPPAGTAGGGGPRSKEWQRQLDEVFAGRVARQTFYHPLYEETMLTIGVPLIIDNTVQGAVILNAPVQHINELMQTIYYYLAAAGLAGFALMALVLRPLVGGIVRPLKEMQAIAQAMAAGQYEQRVAVRQPDEIGQLGESLNSLAQDLGDFVRQMERLEGIRRDFIANVSHEMRTPLTIIRGYNQALADGTVSDPQQVRQYYQLIDEEVLRLQRLIKDVLDLSRLQAGRVEVALEPLPLPALVASVGEMLARKAADKQIRLNVPPSDLALPEIMGHGDRLVQLILILLDNAIQYTPAGGQVEVCLAADATAVKMSVSDTGIGIAAEDLPFVWERFFKADKAHTRQQTGTGLGLAIAREIIEMHGATVELQSEIGRGTTFYLRFPLGSVR